MLPLLLEGVGSVPPSASVIFTDPKERSFSFIILSLLLCVGPASPYADVVVLPTPRERFFRRCLSEWGLYPHPGESSMPTTRDAL